MERIVQIIDVDLQFASEVMEELNVMGDVQFPSIGEQILARYFAKYRVALLEKPANNPPMNAHEFADWVARRRAHEETQKPAEALSVPPAAPWEQWSKEKCGYCLGSPVEYVCECK